MRNVKRMAMGLAALSLLCLAGVAPVQAEDKLPQVGPVALNAHPKSLEGKTVLLRWNSKFNGDKVLDRLAELLTQKVPKVKVVKLYQLDPSTVGVSKDMAESLKTAGKIAALKPDIVIASQAD